MKKLSFVFALLISCIALNAQTTEDSVKAVVNKMFIAMKSSNGKMLMECFADSAILQTISTKGGVKVRTDKLADMAKQVGNLPKDAADERITFDAVKLDGDLASVWTPYKFYYRGNFSHCGVNSFQLVRLNGEWKIQYIIDTRRKEKCD